MARARPLKDQPDGEATDLEEWFRQLDAEAAEAACNCTLLPTSFCALLARLRRAHEGLAHVVMLDAQYRMRPEIQRFPNQVAIIVIIFR